MRNAVILFISIMLLTVAGMWQINYIEESSVYAISDAEYISNLIQNDNFEKASMHMQNLKQTWKDMSKIWNIFITHDEIDEIEEIMVSFEMYTKLKNKEEALVYSERLKRSLKHISNKQRVLLENVL